MATLIMPAAGAVALAAAGLLVRRRVRRPLPRRRGTVTVQGLAGQVRIGRDREGTVHVEAAAMPDAAFAMGYAHAQDRLWQMDFNRRVAAGRISEIAGSSAVEADRFVRRVGLLRLATEEERLLDGERRTMLDAYAAGVNALMSSCRALPLEFSFLRVAPEPWRPVHSLAIAKLLALGLSANWDGELQRLELVRAIGPERAVRFEPGFPDAAPSVISADLGEAPARPDAVRERFDEAARWFPTTGGCSNAWVVSGALTASGRPLLCNDPHLPPSVPGLWYAAHIAAGDDFESAGATVPGLPFPILGHNRHCAWGCTNSFADAQDLVIEEFEDATGRSHRTEAGFADSTLAREVIRVRGASDVVEDVVITRHGPVVEPIGRSPDGRWRGLALQWTANRPGDTAGVLLRLQRAADWESFRAAFAGLDAPSQNVVYADAEGHIGYLLSGRIPVRRRRPSGLPVPGWTGEALWERYLGADEVPQIFDPEDGIIITANNQVVGEDFPHYVASDYMNGYRAARIRELIEARGGGLTPAHMRSVQMDVVCPPARRVAELLGRLPSPPGPGDALRRRLAGWDGTMDPALTEPTIYSAFMRRLAEQALRPACGESWGIVAGTTLRHALFGYPGNLIGRLTPLLLDRWVRDDVSLFDGATTWDEVALRALAAAAGDLGEARPWGRVHALPLIHRPLGRVRGLARFFNAGTIRVGGDSDTVLATSFDPSSPYRTTLFAPSWRQVIDVGDWDRSTAVHLPGQSGQLGSPHRRDLVGRWLRNDQFPLRWGTGVPGRAGRSLTLVPVAPPAPAAGRRAA